MQNKVQWTFANDPFPEIPPALLNSADIQAYQEACGLVQGETFSLDRLKAASYEIPCLGDVYWWDENNDRQQARIEDGRPFKIKKNSIVYVCPDAKFALPDFIAMRFNLTINLVHRGLLLGTGPLVDPGFQGRLLIPLHNLTSQDIPIDSNDGLIWVEFTKLSPLTDASSMESVHGSNRYKFKDFPSKKRNREVAHYFKEASGGPFRSSLTALLGAAELLDEKFGRYAFWGAIGGAIAIATLVVTVIAFWMQSAGVLRDANQWLSESKNGVAAAQSENKKTIDALTTRIEVLESKNTAKERAGKPPGGDRTALTKDSDARKGRDTSSDGKSSK